MAILPATIEIRDATTVVLTAARDPLCRALGAICWTFAIPEGGGGISRPGVVAPLPVSAHLLSSGHQLVARDAAQLRTVIATQWRARCELAASRPRAEAPAARLRKGRA